MLQEGVDQHIQNFYAHNGQPQGQVISVDFKKSLRPGEIYGILIPPGPKEINPTAGQKHVQLVSILMHMEAAPIVHSTFDAASNTEKHEIEVRTTEGVDTTHAIANVQMILGDDRDVGLDRKEDDSP